MRTVLSRCGAGLFVVANRPRLLVAAVAGMFLGCSAAYGLIEHHGPIASMWWALVTASTVGYGDQYPATTAGRGVGALLIASMFVFALIGGAQITARLVMDPHVFTDAEQEEMKAVTRDTNARLRQIHAHLGLPDPDIEDPHA